MPTPAGSLKHADRQNEGVTEIHIAKTVFMLIDTSSIIKFHDIKSRVQTVAKTKD